MVQPEAAAKVVRIECDQKTYPPYDPFHGTNAAMLWRRVTIETASGAAVFEQTDYGHPGRLNPWEPRGIAPSLLPRLRQLSSLVESISELVD
jgi:hypothetical protein